MASTKIPNLVSGMMGSVKDLFAGSKRGPHTETGKVRTEDIQQRYDPNALIDKKLMDMAEFYYREGSFEKIQFARKWMRNALIYQGYHELEWSEINVAWDVVLQDSGDYSFPNNYFRTLVLQVVRALLSGSPQIEPIPTSDDMEAEAASSAARTAMALIKEQVKYDYLRVIEGIYLLLFGNSFRFAYYSLDPRYGHVSMPVYEDSTSVISPGGSMCPQCGPMEGAMSSCPACGSPITDTTEPVTVTFPKVAGHTRIAKGEVATEVVNPLEIYLRSSSYDLWHAPFLVRNRMVDALELQAAYPDVRIAAGNATQAGEAYSMGGDLSLIYLESLADLPGDPTQYASWYERATMATKSLLVEAWIRPALYFFDKEMTKKFPDGVYIAKTGSILLDAKPSAIEDHWSHFVYNPVPGRIWGDGMDDVVNQQLQLDERDRLIMRNQAYNAIPLVVIDSQRINKNLMLSDPSTIVEAKPAGRPVAEAFSVIEGAALPQETWQYRMAHIQDMFFHARYSPSAAGQHQPGVNTYGGQEQMAARSDSSLIPNLMLWKTADEQWARQILRLASENWVADRVRASMGINGQWEFEKLRVAALDLDKFKLQTKVLPLDPQMQTGLSQAVASGLLDPQDPRVQRKALEAYGLPTNLNSFYDDAKVQWKEIRQMEKTGQQIKPVLIRDDDAVHVEVCRSYLNSDEGEANPQLSQLVLAHAQLHVINMSKSAQMKQAASGQPPGALGPGGPPQQGAPAAPQPRGGQIPRNPVVRHQRAQRANVAAPNRPQPPEGNQWHRKPLT